MDWRRICNRSKRETEEGLRGMVIVIGSGIETTPGGRAIEHEIKELPECEANAWIVYKEHVYAVAKLKDESKENGACVRKAAAKATQMLIKHGVKSIVLEDETYMGEWVAEGVVLASYQYDVLHTKKRTQVSIVHKGTSKKIEDAVMRAEAQNFARFMVDTPANLMTPTLFAEYVREYMPESVEVKVHGREEMERMGMHLLLGVASGSAQEPKLLEVKYVGKTSETVALVGKGITFDSGGISLKPPAKMALMKGDMGGGAAVVAAIGAHARAGGKQTVVGIVALTENMPSGTATKPGDVHIGSAGISVEVDNTDAEGRLVLGDALHYAQTFSPAQIIDVATLTGAIDVALGPVMAGLFSNSDELAHELREVSKAVGDEVWRMPVTDEYKSLIVSEVADVKNTGGPKGGSITAALFLKAFVQNTAWAHLDIAAVALGTLVPELYGKGATGRPVKLLTAWLHSKGEK